MTVANCLCGKITRKPSKGECTTVVRVWWWPIANKIYKLIDPSNWHCVRCIHILQMAPPSRVAAAVRVAKCEYSQVGTQIWHFRMENSLNAGEGAKFKLVKTMFNAEGSIRRLSQSIFSNFSTIRSWNVCHSQKLPKIHKKILFWRSRSSKVIAFCAYRKPV